MPSDGNARTRRVRLDRLLSNMGYGSRRQAADDIRAGFITRDGAALTDPSSHIILDGRARDLVIDGEPIDPLPPMVLVYHKPVGVVCSHEHEDGARIVFDDLPPRFRHRDPLVSIAGRLDKDSRGLVVLTDDGEFLHTIISPRRHAIKHYRVTLAENLRGNEEALFASGTLLLTGETKPLKPARFIPDGPRGGVMQLSEGRFRQIRRMFVATNNDVTDLVRFRIGAFDLPDDLKEGEWRLLDEAGRNALLSIGADGPEAG